MAVMMAVETTSCARHARSISRTFQPNLLLIYMIRQKMPLQVLIGPRRAYSLFPSIPTVLEIGNWRSIKTLIEPSKEVLEECKNGNQQAFKEIFYNYRSYAYNLIYKITGKTSDQEDLLQEIFFQIYLSLKTFRGDSSFSTWFHRIVINVCTGHWRYQQAKKRISVEDTVDYDSVEHIASNHNFQTGHQMKNKGNSRQGGCRA